MARTDRHLVVDGSNIATEGRSLPSLTQLDEAVRAISQEYEYDSLTVIVDATFAHRIDESERDEFEEAVSAGEIVAPPAGAIGRGDAFILQVASKAGAVVFSNDSFQEFHGEHDWLFEQGRLIGGKPIEGVGWVFVERAPVRGPASRRSVREAEQRAGKRTKSGAKSGSRSSGRGRSSRAPKAAPKAASKEASGPPPVPTASTPPPKKSSGTRARRKPEELNDARSFMSFVSTYSIGDEVEAVVEQFSSHGCYLRAASARCYLPSRAMGDPPPTRARDVVASGQTVIVKVESLDADRRGINVELVRVIDDGAEEQGKKQGKDSEATRTRHRYPASIPQQPEMVADDSGREGDPTRRATTVATTKKSAARKTTAKKSAAKKTTAKKAATATSSARVKRAAAKKTAAKKTTTKKSTAKKATKATAKKTTAKKATAKKAPAKKTAAKKTTTKKATAKKAPAKKTTAKKATKAAAKKTTAKKTATKRNARKAGAKKTTARKATAKKAASS